MNGPRWSRDGSVCAVTFSGSKADDQWPGSRAIAAEKANTTNGFSLKGFALSTANLYASAQPGGTLYGAATSNPVVTEVLYAGDQLQFGTASDPMVGKNLGGVIVFGGDLLSIMVRILSAALASAATPPAPITTLLGACGTHSHWITSRTALRRATTTASSMEASE